MDGDTHVSTDCSRNLTRRLSKGKARDSAEWHPVIAARLSHEFAQLCGKVSDALATADMPSTPLGKTSFGASAAMGKMREGIRTAFDLFRADCLQEWPFLASRGHDNIQLPRWSFRAIPSEMGQTWIGPPESLSVPDFTRIRGTNLAFRATLTFQFFLPADFASRSTRQHDSSEAQKQPSQVPNMDGLPREWVSLNRVYAIRSENLPQMGWTGMVEQVQDPACPNTTLVRAPTTASSQG